MDSGARDYGNPAAWAGAGFPGAGWGGVERAVRVGGG